tara:strand:- start:196 stop:1860 length:1665 start_codon:yes stop_codon:yes gene_type:complete
MRVLTRNIKNLIKKYTGYHNPNLPDIKKLNLIQNLSKNKKFKNQKILIATSSGGLYPQLIFESILGIALDFKGADVEFLLCDGILPACIMCTTVNISEEELIKNGPKSLCSNCYFDGYNYLKKSNIKINKLSNFLLNNDKIKAKKICKRIKSKKIKNFIFDKIPVGNHAYAGALRYYATTDLDSEENGKKVLKKYFEASLLSKLSLDNFFEKKSYDLIIMNHGIYVPQGIINEYAKKKKYKIVTWFPWYRKRSYCFFRGDTYQKEYLTEKNSLWENLRLTKEKKDKLSDYLISRKTGKNDWRFYYENPSFDKDLFFKRYDIDKNKPIIGMATNVIWDAQIDYPKQFFNSILDWVFHTIKFFKKTPNMQLVIRVHPAEVTSDRKAKQKIAEEINKKFKNLPKNIIVIPPEDPISSYTIFENCNSAIIYASKIGIELCAAGTPVIVVGPGQIKNKKIAYDVNSYKQYNHILNQLPLSKKKYLNKHKILRAKKYAYHAFFRKPTLIKSVYLTEDRWPNISIDKNFYKILKRNKDPGLDFICDAILNEKQFINDKNEF